MQVEGSRSWPLLRAKLRAGGPAVLFHGGGAAVAASAVSHYPWFFVVRTPEATPVPLPLLAIDRKRSSCRACSQYNLLDSRIPVPESAAATVVRNGGIGFSAAAAAAIASNWARVIKTLKQTHADARVSYGQVCDAGAGRAATCAAGSGCATRRMQQTHALSCLSWPSLRP